MDEFKSLGKVRPLLMKVLSSMRKEDFFSFSNLTLNGMGGRGIHPLEVFPPLCQNV